MSKSPTQVRAGLGVCSSRNPHTQPRTTPPSWPQGMVPTGLPVSPLPWVGAPDTPISALRNGMDKSPSPPLVWGWQGVLLSSSQGRSGFRCPLGLAPRNPKTASL